MRCKACNKALSDYESTRKSDVSKEFIDLCNGCYSTISQDILTTDREDLLNPDTFTEDNL